MKPKRVRLQNCHSQTGIEKEPILCWEYDEKDFGKVQHTYQIIIKCDDKTAYKSDKIISAEQNNIEVDLLLESHRKYEVIIGITDNTGTEEWSAPAIFITGMSKKENWKADWISDGTGKPYITGQTISIRSDIKEAFVSCCGLGQYELRINGTTLNQNVLEGVWTDYNKQVQYQTYDVTSQLKNGSNHLMLETANGWYLADTSENRHFYTLDKGYKEFGKTLPSILQLTIRYQNGEEEIVGTDATWWVEKSPTTLANVYGSEDYDARLEQLYPYIFQKEHTFLAKVLKSEEQPKGVLTPQLHPPITVKQVYEAKSISKIKTDGILFDFGQNMSGLFEIYVKGKSGDRIKVTPVEKLDMDSRPIITVPTWSYYTLKGSDEVEVWRPKFSYAAGRWIYVEGAVWHEESEDTPRIQKAMAYFITSAAEDVSEFICSDERYMQIHSLVKKAIESNLQHVHTDCPIIEKLGWQEPNHLMGPSIMYLKEVDTLWSKFAADLRDSQYGSEEYDVDESEYKHSYGPGLIPSIAPRYAKFIKDYGSGSFWDITPWGSSILLGAYHQQHFYGNHSIVVKNYEDAKKYVDYLFEKYSDYNNIYNKIGEEKFLAQGLGDWGCYVKGQECRENVETAFLYMDLTVLSQFAKQLGKMDEAAEYQKMADEVKQSYNKCLLIMNDDRRWYYRAYGKEESMITQTNQAIPLYFGMVPKELEPTVKETFLETVSDRQFYAGEIGLKYIFLLLAKYGDHDRIHDMIMQPEHPSYYRFIQHGETTLPEFWEDDARSRNHDMMGHVMEWFYKEVAGISSTDGFRTIRISPNLPKLLEFVKCTYHSIRGEIYVYYQKKSAGHYILSVTIPPNCKGIITLSKETEQYIVEGGHYQFNNESH